MAKEQKIGRQRAVSELKRELILNAARSVFEAEGLEGASLRAIAADAGYTPAALYFHFESKEAIYAEVLRCSLESLGQTVTRAVARAKTPGDRLRAAAMAFFRYYSDNPKDLDLGFYLFRGGMKPRGLGRERDDVLNRALEAALEPVARAAQDLGAGREAASIADGGYFCSCGRPPAIGQYWPHAHVWGLGATSHGTFRRGADRGAHRKAEGAPLNPPSRGPTLQFERVSPGFVVG